MKKTLLFHSLIVVGCGSSLPRSSEPDSTDRPLSNSGCSGLIESNQMTRVISSFPVGGQSQKPNSGYCYESETGFEGSRDAIFNIDTKNQDICASEVHEWTAFQGYIRGVG